MPRTMRPLVLLIVLALASCVPPPRGTALYGPLPPQPPGTARLIVYRTVEYYDTLQTTTVFFNGTPIAPLQVGTVLYRDVAPGQYNVTVSSPQAYPNQFKSVVVGPGNVFYMRVDTLPNPPCAQRFIALCRDTVFIVTVVDPATGLQQIQGLLLTPG